MLAPPGTGDPVPAAEAVRGVLVLMVRGKPQRELCGASGLHGGHGAGSCLRLTAGGTGLRRGAHPPPPAHHPSPSLCTVTGLRGLVHPVQAPPAPLLPGLHPPQPPPHIALLRTPRPPPCSQPLRAPSQPQPHSLPTCPHQGTPLVSKPSICGSSSTQRQPPLHPVAPPGGHGRVPAPGSRLSLLFASLPAEFKAQGRGSHPVPGGRGRGCARGEKRDGDAPCRYAHPARHATRGHEGPARVQLQPVR